MDTLSFPVVRKWTNYAKFDDTGILEKDFLQVSLVQSL